MEESRTFLPLLIVIFLAFLVPLVLSRFSRFRLPIVVGEILVGILIGRSGFGLVTEHDPVLDLLAEFGFVFLFFLAGTEIDFTGFRGSSNDTESKRNKLFGILPLSIITYLLTLLLSFFAGYWMYIQGLVTNAWIMALIFAPSALGIILAVLKEKGLNRNKYGQAILSVALVADFGTLLLFTVTIAIISSGLTLDILLIGLLFVAFLIFYRFGYFFFNQIKPVRRVLEELSTATAQIKVRLAFTILLIFVVLAEIVGTEVVLGAFLAGAMVSLLSTPSDREALHQLEAVGFGFFIPIFFIMIGVDFNLNALLESPPVTALNIPGAFIWVPVFLLISLAVKFIPAGLFKIHFSWSETFAFGALLSSRLSLIVAEAAIALSLGIINESVNSAVILTAMLLATFSPLLFNRLIPDKKEESSAPILITGAGELGIQIGQQLVLSNQDVLLIDPDDENVMRAKAHSLPAIKACVNDRDPATTPYFSNSNTLINTYEDIDLNYEICSLAKQTFQIETVVTLVSKPSELSRFKALGVTTMNPALDQAAMMVLLALNPTAYELLTRTDDEKCLREVTIENGEISGKKLRTIQLVGEVLVLALRREGDLIVPHGNTEIMLHDHLTLVGNQEDVEVASMIFK